MINSFWIDLPRAEIVAKMADTSAEAVIAFANGANQHERDWLIDTETTDNEIAEWVRECIDNAG